MPTLVEFLPVSTGPSPVSVTSVTADDVALAQLAGAGKLTGWWRADQGLSPAGWIDRVADLPLSAQRGALPSNSAIGTNGKPFLSPAAGPQCLISPPGVLPANGSFSVAVVARIAVSPPLGAFWGNNAASGGFWGGIDSNQRVYLGGVGPLGATTFQNSSGAKLFIWSFQYNSGSSQQVRLRVNGVDIATSNAGTNFTALSWSSTQLTLFDAGATNFSPVANSEIYDCFVFPLALHTDPATLAVLETYVRNRMAIF